MLWAHPVRNLSNHACTLRLVCKHIQSLSAGTNVSFVNSNFSHNAAAFHGGGIMCIFGFAYVANTVISDNMCEPLSCSALMEWIMLSRCLLLAATFRHVPHVSGTHEDHSRMEQHSR